MKHWYWRILLLLLSMYVSTSILYRFTTDSVDYKKTSKLKVSREYDFTLYKVNDDVAFSIGKSNYISLVKYKKTIFPFCYLCGEFESNGTVVNGAEFKFEDWFYTEYSNPFSEAYNIQTQELIDIPEKGLQGEDLKVNELFIQKNLLFKENNKINPEFIKANYPSLSTLNESCIIFNAAFGILIGGWILIGCIRLLLKKNM